MNVLFFVNVELVVAAVTVAVESSAVVAALSEVSKILMEASAGSVVLPLSSEVSEESEDSEVVPPSSENAEESEEPEIVLLSLAAGLVPFAEQSSSGMTTI
jgi:hypothetical protein